MEIGELHALATVPLGKQSPTPNKLGRSQTVSGFLAEQKYILSKLITEQFLKSPVCYIVTILTELL
jgi:hypothetical protein